MRRKRSIVAALLAAALALAPATAPAQQANPVDPVSGLPIPLLPGEMAFRFKNGCSVIAAPEQVEATRKAGGVSKTSWYGACKFGLADGPGYLFTEGTDYKAIGLKSPYQAATAHFGLFGSVGKRAGDDTDYAIDRSADGASESVDAKDGLVPPPGSFREKLETFASVLERNGKFGDLILASHTRTTGARSDSDYLRIQKIACPSTGSSKIEKSLASVGAGVPLSAAQIKTLVPFCKLAVARLKQEGRVSEWWDYFQAFEKVDYGYFFLLVVERDARMTAADGTVTYIELPPEQKYSGVTLCPQPGDLASCEPLWRAMQQPYIQRRTEIREQARQAEIAATLDRERRFAPLDAVLKQKIAALARSGGGSQ
jgi:hypothetical protein